MKTIEKALLEKAEQGHPETVELLDSESDFCQYLGNKTLFDVMIVNDNRDVMEKLVTDKAALEFAAPIDDDLSSAINYMLGEVELEASLEKAESRLKQSFGDQLNFARTPLLTACRVGNEHAMTALLNAGAKASAKDRLKLMAPEVCFYARGPEGLKTFIDVYSGSGQKPFSANANLIRALLPYPDLLESLKTVAKFGAPVQKLLFCYDCARLDVEAVRQTLASGKFDINKSVTTQLHPLREACFSYLFWSDELPEADYYAFHYTKLVGPAGSHSIHIDNDLIAEDGSNFARLMRDAEQKRKALMDAANALRLSEEQKRSQLDKRCKIVDLLFEAGLDRKLAEDKLDEFFWDQMAEMPLQPLMTKLSNYGLGAQSVSAEADASWELAGESVLEARALYNDDGGWPLELTYHNVYGPINGITLSVRAGDTLEPTPADQPQIRTDWRKLSPTEQWLDVEGDWVSLSQVKEPVGETPWKAVYHWHEVVLPEVMEVWVQSPSEGINTVLTDWELD